MSNELPQTANTIQTAGVESGGMDAPMPGSYDFTPDEIAERLERVFNGYLGCDTGDTPGELQTNHHLIQSIIKHFKH